MKPVDWDRLRAAIDQFTADDGPEETAAPAAATVSDEGEIEYREEVFARVSKLLPEAQIRAHVDALEACVAALAEAAANDVEAIEAAAHKVVSQAGMLGLFRLSDRASALEQACRTGTGVRHALKRFRLASGDVRDHLELRSQSAPDPLRQARGSH